MTGTGSDPWLTRLIVGAVVVGWLSAQVASMIHPAYQPSAALNAVFLSLVGGVLALSQKKGGEE